MKKKEKKRKLAADEKAIYATGLNGTRSIECRNVNPLEDIALEYLPFNSNHPLWFLEFRQRFQHGTSVASFEKQTRLSTLRRRLLNL